MKNIKHVAKLLLFAAIATIPNTSQTAGSYGDWFRNLRRATVSDMTTGLRGFGSSLWGTAQEYPTTTAALSLGGLGLVAAYYRNYYMQGALKAVKDLLTSESYISNFIQNLGTLSLNERNRKLINKIQWYTYYRLPYFKYIAPSSVSELYIQSHPYIEVRSNIKSPIISLWARPEMEEKRKLLLLRMAEILAKNDEKFANEFIQIISNDSLKKYDITNFIEKYKDIYISIDKALNRHNKKRKSK